MKFDEVVQLDELSLKDAVKYGVKGATALIGAGMLATAVHNANTSDSNDNKKLPSSISGKVTVKEMTRAERQAKLAAIVLKKYHIDKEKAWNIVDAALDNEDITFPKAEDILSIAGIESSFNDKAVSRLKKDPARGLMQVRPAVWKLTPADFRDIEDQIEHGANILKQYFKQLGSKEDAVHAYNVGITAFKSGDEDRLNPQYVAKFEAERKRYK